MGRLTQKTESGKWQVRGLPWEKLREGETIAKETSQLMYGCLCKLKDYEDTGMNPDQLGNWWYELEEMAGHVCDDLCHYRRKTKEQEKLDGICAGCPVSACMEKLLELTDQKGTQN